MAASSEELGGIVGDEVGDGLAGPVALGHDASLDASAGDGRLRLEPLGAGEAA